MTNLVALNLLQLLLLIYLSGLVASLQNNDETQSLSHLESDVYTTGEHVFSRPLITLFNEYPNVFSDNAELLSRMLTQALLLPSDYAHSELTFLIFHETQNLDEFSEISDNPNDLHRLGLSYAILSFLSSHNITNARVLTICYHYGVAKLVSLEPNKIASNVKTFRRVFLHATSIFNAMQLAFNINFPQIIDTSSPSFVRLIFDYRQGFPKIQNQKLVHKLWHSYDIIDDIALTFRRHYSAVHTNLSLVPQIIKYNETRLQFNSDGTHDNVVEKSFQEQQYELTANMVYTSNDFWITFCDVALTLVKTEEINVKALNAAVEDMIKSSSSSSDSIEVVHSGQNGINNSNTQNVTHKVLIIFLESFVIFRYIPYLINLPCRFILISDCNDDVTVPDIYHPQPDQVAYEYVMSFINNPKLIKWYAKNLSVRHDKLVPLPIGLKLQLQSDMFLGMPKQHNIDIANKHCLAPSVKFYNQSLKTNLLYFNFALHSTENPFYADHTNMRPYVHNVLIKNNFTFNENYEYDQYLSVLSTYKFAMAPPGRGIDTHRAWESLMVGAIPIIIRSTMDSIFEQLPVLLITKDEVQLITEEFLLHKYVEIVHTRTNDASSSPYNFDKLYAPYWRRHILQAKKTAEQYHS